MPRETSSGRLIGDSYQADADDLDRLRAIAVETNKSKADLIRTAIKDFIKKYDRGFK